jgi:predicted kinase
MLPLFGDSMAGGVRHVLEGRLIAMALDAFGLGVKVVVDFGVWAKDERSALRWLASTVGAECALVYVAIDAPEQARRAGELIETTAEPTFPLTQTDLNEWRGRFQPPDADELPGVDLDPPPSGFHSWRDWIAHWWPISLGQRSTTE